MVKKPFFVYRKRYLWFLIISIAVHYILFTMLPNYHLTPKENEDDETMIFLEPIFNGPKKITFTNQKVNNERPDHAEFLAEHDNLTNDQVKNTNQLEPEEIRNPDRSFDLKYSEEGDVEVESARREDQLEYPSLEEYLEDFKDKDNIREDDYVSINTVSFRYISYFKRLKQRIEFVLNLPEEAAAKGINGEGIVGFTIRNDGKLMDAEILETTGYRILDEEMLSALREAAPYEKLPTSMNMEFLRIKAPFTFRVVFSAY